jgi:hypothetical protein
VVPEAVLLGSEEENGKEIFGRARGERLYTLLRDASNPKCKNSYHSRTSFNVQVLFEH